MKTMITFSLQDLQNWLLQPLLQGLGLQAPLQDLAYFTHVPVFPRCPYTVPSPELAAADH